MSHLRVHKLSAATILLLSSSVAYAQESCCYEEVCCPTFCGYNITVSGSALYWQPHEEGLDYAIKNQAGTAFANRDARVERVNFNSNFGFRIALGYQIPCGKMDLQAIWTRFYGSGSDSSTAPPFGGLFQVWTIPGSGLTAAQNARAKWHSKLNVLDLRMSTLFAPCCFLQLRPFISLTNAWIDQTFNVTTSGGTNTQIANAIVISDAIRMKNNFWGIGPKAGLDTSWALFCGISFYGNIDASILYGRFDLKQSEVVRLTGLNNPITYLDIDHNNYHLSRVNLDLEIGLKWECLLFSNCCNLLIQAGWENLYFFGQNQFMRFQTTTFPGINTSNQGDLSYQGLTLKASLTF